MKFLTLRIAAAAVSACSLPTFQVSANSDVENIIKKLDIVLAVNDAERGLEFETQLFFATMMSCWESMSKDDENKSLLRGHMDFALDALTDALNSRSEAISAQVDLMTSTTGIISPEKSTGYCGDALDRRKAGVHHAATILSGIRSAEMHEIETSTPSSP